MAPFFLSRALDIPVGPTSRSHSPDMTPWWHLWVPLFCRGAMVRLVGPTQLTWRSGPTGGSHNHEVGHGPTQVGPTVMTWRHGPIGMTWRYGPTSGSRVVDLAPLSHQWVPTSGSQPCWRGDWVPPLVPASLTWRHGPTSGIGVADVARHCNSPSIFYLAKKLLLRSFEPATSCWRHRRVTTRPRAGSWSVLVYFFICLVKICDKTSKCCSRGASNSLPGDTSALPLDQELVHGLSLYIFLFV